MSDSILPVDENLEALGAAGDEGPVVMVNFLKFKPGGGSKAYGKYAAAFSEMLTAGGGRFLFQGRVEAKLVGDEDWHAVALVEYPSRAAFKQLVGSPEYKAVHHYREEGLEKTLLYAVKPR
ncbi:MAG: DUF1330 domain-containing protein [Acidobacteriota bacterium]|nr:DUF1330 domain-containing protein [Acidobacteriota bacterium]